MSKRNYTKPITKAYPTSTKLATMAQILMIKKLCKQHAITEPDYTDLTKDRASTMIGKMMLGRFW